MQSGPPATSGAASAATPTTVDASAVVHLLDLYPVKLSNGPRSRHAARAVETQHKRRDLAHGKHDGDGAAAQVPDHPLCPTPSADASSASSSLPPVESYRSTAGQLQDRVVTTLNRRLAALVYAKLHERKQASVLAERLASPQVQAVHSSPPLSPAAGEKEGCEWVARAGSPASSPPTAAATSTSGLMCSTTSATAASRHAGRGTGRAALPQCGGGGGDPAPSSAPPGTPPGGGSGLSVRALAGTYPAGTPLFKGMAATGAAHEPTAGGDVVGPPDYGAVELVRVHRLRGIPNHNRGLFAGSQAPAFTTRSGSMTLGVTGARHKRVRPAAWGALWEDRHSTSDPATPSRLSPPAGITGAQWLARYQARGEAGNKTAGRGGGRRSHGSSLVMRSYGSGGRTYFQWIKDGKRRSGSEADDSADGSSSDGRGPPGAIIGRGQARGSRDLALDPASEDIDLAIDRVVSRKYGKSLTKEERDEARRLLRERRKGSQSQKRGAAHGGNSTVEEAPPPAADSPPHEHPSSAHQTEEESASYTRPDTGTGRYLPPNGRSGSIVRRDSEVARGGTDSTGPYYDEALEWGHLALPSDHGLLQEAFSPHSLTPGSTTCAPGKLHSPLERTLTAAEAERVSRRTAQSRDAHLAGGKGVGGGDTFSSSHGGAGGMEEDGGEWRASGRSHSGSLDDSVREDGPGRSGSDTQTDAKMEAPEDGSRPESASATMPNVPAPTGGQAEQTTALGGGGAGTATGEVRGVAKSGGREANVMPPSTTAKDGQRTGKEKGKRTRRVRRLPDGTLETLSDEDNEAERQEGQLRMFLANFPESEEHVRLRRQANNILAGLGDFGDSDAFPMLSFSEASDGGLLGQPQDSSHANATSTAPRKTGKGEEHPVSGFQLDEQKLRDKFRREAEAEYADLIKLRDQLRREVADQRALKTAFTTDIHSLSDTKVGDHFAVALTREVNEFARKHGLTLRQMVADDALMDGDIEEVADGFLDRFWKGKIETKDVGCQVADEDLGYVDEGVRAVEAHMEDLFYHEHGLLSAIKLATVAVANIMSFHSSLELESTCKECFFLFDRPRTLWPCGHTFCQRCLAGMYNKRDELICAECGSVCEVGYTPNLSVELIANYQVVQGSDAGGSADAWSNRNGTSAAPHIPVGGGGGASTVPRQSQTIEGILRTLLVDLAATQKSCVSSRDALGGMLPVQRV